MNSGLREMTVFSKRGDDAVINMDFVLERGCGDSGKEGNQIPMF